LYKSDEYDRLYALKYCFSGHIEETEIIFGLEIALKTLYTSDISP